MVEIIKRCEGQFSEKEQINGNNKQVSYNNWGHLAVRIMQPIPESEEGERDTLIVFDSVTSKAIIEFIQEGIRTHQQMPF